MNAAGRFTTRARLRSRKRLSNSGAGGVARADGLRPVAKGLLQGLDVMNRARLARRAEVGVAGAAQLDGHAQAGGQGHDRRVAALPFAAVQEMPDPGAVA